MIEETLHREAAKFTEVLEQFAKTYKKEFTIGEFNVCLAVSSGVHEEPIILFEAGCMPSILKNFKFMTKHLNEIAHDKDTIQTAG